jgi:L,D-transpeptidase catalytic domain
MSNTIPPSPAAVATVAPASMPDIAAEQFGSTPALGMGPVRLWQGLLIQSLDPLPRRGFANHLAQPPAGAAAHQLLTREHRPWELNVPSTRARPRNWILSNEHTITRWAYTEQLAPIRAHPRGHGRVISRLRWYTDDGFPELYLLLRIHRDAKGQDWVKLRSPMRPNGGVGWVRREALGDFHTTWDLLVVDRERRLREFFTDGCLRWSAPVGVGDAITPTAPGHFWIRKRFKIFDPSSGYWPYAFGTIDYATLGDWPGGGMGGIHGPDFEPRADAERASGGSMRLQVADDTWLANHLQLGTPLLVR